MAWLLNQSFRNRDERKYVSRRQVIEQRMRDMPDIQHKESYGEVQEFST